ncbi:MAG: putative methyltransferase [Clostridia bacterium]|nr:MAG: putative methyltransferase [Clostridia bacterium]
MERSAQQITRAILEEPLSLWELLPLTGNDATACVSALQNLLTSGLVTRQGNKFALTPAGRERAREMKLTSTPDLTCPACEGKGLVPQVFFSQVETELAELAHRRPDMKAEFDQGCVRVADSLGRVLVMYRQGDLEGREILFLGDDDLTSLAAALTGLPAGITVLEIDPQLVAFLRTVAQERGWENLRVREYDVRNPWPEDLHGQFDVAVTDPVETRAGFTLFLSRATEGLRGPGTALYFGLTRLESDLARWGYFQQTLLQMGWVITEILPSFHRYHLPGWQFVLEECPGAVELDPGAPSPGASWYTSSLVRLEAPGELRPAHTGEVRLGAELYVDGH